MSAPLPPGWEAKFTDDGRPFYINHQTKTTHWELPAEIAAQMQAPEQATPAPVQAAPVQAAPMMTTSTSTSTPGGGELDLLELAEQGGVSVDQIMAMAEATSSQFGSEWKVHDNYFLYIPVNGLVYVKRGSMCGYTGKLKFERGSGGGFANKLMKSFTGEGARMMKAKGEGQLWVGDQMKNIIVVRLNNDGIIVNGNDLIAFEDGLKWSVTMMKGASGMLSGGLFNVKIQGVGRVAIGTLGKPLLMAAGPSRTIYTDPQATVAWSSSLDPKLKADVSFKSVLGKGSGEEMQMNFSGPGEGFVIVQPYEEIGHAE